MRCRHGVGPAATTCRRRSAKSWPSGEGRLSVPRRRLHCQSRGCGIARCASARRYYGNARCSGAARCLGCDQIRHVDAPHMHRKPSLRDTAPDKQRDDVVHGVVGAHQLAHHLLGRRRRLIADPLDHGARASDEQVGGHRRRREPHRPAVCPGQCREAMVCDACGARRRGGVRSHPRHGRRRSNARCVVGLALAKRAMPQPRLWQCNRRRGTESRPSPDGHDFAIFAGKSWPPGRRRGGTAFFVMAGLDPAICAPSIGPLHGDARPIDVVDGRVKPGHEGRGSVHHAVRHPSRGLVSHQGIGCAGRVTSPARTALACLPVKRRRPAWTAPRSRPSATRRPSGRHRHDAARAGNPEHAHDFEARLMVVAGE